MREALERSAMDLGKMAEAHRQLVSAALGADPSPLRCDRCPFLDCKHRIRLRQMVAEVVRALEETRKSFKSKQLEALRHRLMAVLSEES